MKLLNCAIAIIMLATPVSAQEIPAEVQRAMRNRPTISIVAHQTQRALTSSFDVDVVVSNLTENRVEISDVTLLLPEAVASTRSIRRDTSLVEEAFVLAPGSERVLRYGVGQMQRSLMSNLLDFRALWFFPGEYVLRATASYQSTASDGTATEQSGASVFTTSSIALDAPLNSIVKGGILGALLLAFFVPLYRWSHRRKSEDRMTLREGILLGATLFTSGAVVATTAILILQRLGDLSLPIVVEVNDYLGGVIVGLFSFKIGDSLYSQFFEGGEQEVSPSEL